MSEDSWTRLVGALALDQQLVGRMLERHVNDGDGRCRFCRVAGPCALRQLAERAARAAPS